MSKYSIGIDCGSTACKGVLIRESADTAEPEIKQQIVRPSGWNPRQTAAEVVRVLLETAGLTRDEVVIVATGYGRMNIE